MKKVFVIADKQATISQIEEIRKALLDPKRPVLVASELFIKQVINLDFDDGEVIKEDSQNVVEFKVQSKPITFDMIKDRSSRLQ